MIQFLFSSNHFFQIISKILAALAIFCSISVFAQSPSLSWAKSLGSSQSDNANDVKYDNSGNVYTIGSYQGTVDFDPSPSTFTLTSTGLSDIFITKFDMNGNFIWAVSMGGSTGDDIGNALNIDPSGNILATGSFNSISADFDPGTQTFLLGSYGDIDIFILKLDANGNFVWAKRIGSTVDENSYSIATDASSNVYSTGYFKGNVDFNPGPATNTLTASGIGNVTKEVFISKLDANGNYVNAYSFGGVGDDVAYSIQLDASGNLYLGGSFTNGCDFQPGIGTSVINSYGNSDGFIASYDVTVNLISVKRIGGGGYDEVYSYVVNSTGNNYFTGSFTGTADFDFSTATYSVTANGITDAFICKYNSAGNFSWAKTLGSTGSDNSYKLSVDNSGNVYTCGTFSNTVDFDPGAGTYTLTSNGGQDAYILKLNSAGSFVWVSQIGSTGTDFARSLIVNSSNEIYTVGSFQSTVDFDPTVATYSLTSNGSDDLFIQKLNQQCVTPATPTDNTPTANLTVCSSSSTTLSAIGTGTINWYSTPTSTTSIGTGSVFITPTLTTGTYTYYAAATTCTVSASRLPITISVNATPTISVNSGSICSGKSFTMSPSGASTYTFQGGSAVVSPTANTSYTVIGTSATGCVSSGFATSNVTVNASPTISVNSGSICTGKSFTISPSGASTYTFQGVSAVVSPTANTSYTVTGTSAAGCVSSGFATSNVTVNASPTITVNNGTICSGQSFTMVPSGATTYTFQGGSAVVSPASTTSYTVSGTSSFGCVSASPATSNVSVNATPTISLAGGAICPGGSFTLSPSGASTYTFSSGPIVSPTTTTSYSVSGTSAAGCVSSGSAVATVTVAASVTVTIAGSNAVCIGSPINLTAGGATTYTWNTGATTSTIAPSPTVNTTYTVTGASGSCSNTAVTSITVNPLPSVSSITSNTLICTGQSSTLTASGANTYTWSSGGSGTTISISPSVTTTFTVTGTDVNGCQNSSTITQSVSLCTGIAPLTNISIVLEIFPNPTTGKLNLNLSENLVGKQVQVYSLIGELIQISEFRTINSELDLSSQPNGIYFIRIGSITKKIIKQ